MKRILGILICMLGISVYAVDYTPASVQPAAPAINMQSVNNSTMMSSGSAYSSAVQEVGATSPNKAPQSGPRKAGGPGTDASGYDPQNPQYGPVGDALIPLLIMALGFVGYIAIKRRKRNIDI